MAADTAPSDDQDALRRASRALFDSVGLPHRRVEGWRWSDVRAALTAPSGENAKGGFDDPFGDLDCPRISAEASGWRCSDRLMTDWLIQPEIGHSLSEGDSPLALLALAEATPRCCVRLTPRNLKPEGEGRRPPLTIALAAGGDHNGVSGVVRIDVPAGHKVRLIESHVSARACANILLFLNVGEGAELERIQFCAGGAGAVIASTAFVRLAESARLTQTSLSFGARLSRLETIVSHDGAGAVATLNGAYLLDRGSHSDFTTRVTHASRGCISRQKVKGACCPGAVAAFQGRYHILQSGQQADATMEHHGLLLGDGAEINAKPELEIYADDVRCAHGATTGRLDGDMLFYMRQRGLPESEARAMLLESFLAEAFADADPASAALLNVVAREMLGRLA